MRGEEEEGPIRRKVTGPDASQSRIFGATWILAFGWPRSGTAEFRIGGIELRLLRTCCSANSEFCGA